MTLPAPELMPALAGPEDDRSIRRLLAASSVPGYVELASERSPSYFLSCGTMGRVYDVGVVRRQPSGEVVGLGYRGLQPRFVNGTVETIGYVTDVLVDRAFQRRWVYARLLRILRESHEDGRIGGYLFVLGGQHTNLIRNVLPESARWYLPAVRELERLWTLALIVRPRRPGRPSCKITRGARDDLPEIVAFFGQHGPRRQFFPAYAEEDFAPGAPLTLGFRVEDFLLARRAGRLVGVLGLWDRSGFKQTVVRAYRRPLGWARPLYDRAARLIGARPLPRPGQRVNCAYVSFTCIADDDPTVFRALLEHARHLACERGYAHLMVGLCASDPLLRVARRFLHLPYESRVYTLSYEGEPSLHERLDGRTPYLELAAV